MDRNSHVREAQLRAIAIFATRPECAQVVNTGTAEVRDGLGCTYEQDGHCLTVDMPTAVGGSDDAPSPGYFGRAAICSCVAIGIKMTAAREAVDIGAVRVGIAQDWDNRGVLGMDGASAVPSDTRIAIEVQSAEDAKTVSDMVSRALASDPWLLAFRDAQPVNTSVSVCAVADA